MRLSVERGDPGYSEADRSGYEVYRNGRKLSNVVTADEEAGYVKMHLLDEKGAPAWDLETEEWIKVELWDGEVELRRKEA